MASIFTATFTLILLAHMVVMYFKYLSSTNGVRWIFFITLFRIYMTERKKTLDDSLGLIIFHCWGRLAQWRTDSIIFLNGHGQPVQRLTCRRQRAGSHFCFTYIIINTISNLKPAKYIVFDEFIFFHIFSKRICLCNIRFTCWWLRII